MRGPVSEWMFTRREALGLGAAAAGLAIVRPARARPQTELDLDTFVRGQMRAGRIPGLSVAVVKPDGRIWSRGYGLANIAHERRANRDTELADTKNTTTGVIIATYLPAKRTG